MEAVEHILNARIGMRMSSAFADKCGFHSAWNPKSAFPNPNSRKRKYTRVMGQNIGKIKFGFVQH